MLHIICTCNCEYIKIHDNLILLISVLPEG